MHAEELHQALLAIEGLRVRPGEPMARHTPLRVGGAADLWAVAEDLGALRKALQAARKLKVRWRLHWPFQDWVVRDGRLPGLTVRPGAGFEGIEQHEDRLVLGAATPWAALSGLGSGWWGALAAWPGCPGSTFSEGEGDRLAGMIEEITYFRGRGLVTVPAADDGTVPTLPRTAILVSVVLRPGFLVFDGEDGPQPPRAGRLFADPEVAGRTRPAARLLSEAEFTGTRLRSWQLSTEEPGLVVNLGGGTARDLSLLVQAVSARMEKFNGIKLATCLPVLGSDSLAPRRPLRGRR